MLGDKYSFDRASEGLVSGLRNVRIAGLPECLTTVSYRKDAKASKSTRGSP